MCERERSVGMGRATVGVDVTLLKDTRRRVVSLSENTDRMSGVEL